MRDYRRARKGVMAVAVSLALLGGLAAESVLRPRAEESEPYHARVRAMAAAVPIEIGDWVGTDYPAPVASIQLLKPNIILSRQYVNTHTGAAVQVLLVHCKDANDIYGHYPPRCYPSHGMKQKSVVPSDWVVGDVKIEGKEYVFEASRLGSEDKLVDNFLIVPGRYVRDMTAVGELAGDYTRRHYGAAQVQVVFQGSHRWTEPQLQEVFQTMIAAYLPLIEQIRNGAQP